MYSLCWDATRQETSAETLRRPFKYSWAFRRNRVKKTLVGDYSNAMRGSRIKIVS
ncbi:hypothetical protein K443DRAFT_328801 [Laccaria amethystina LaAM-08-1]|uniref:Uncharacterized protein n=1 Tax=Laccaria amethystina LaAM-08-1 TaxID=1095629 RepID=A0A0C9XH55_9AGAR|nr:hypothetical protein K443DRAFT_328801 [Laccaria amethystina LaAM-08-1]